MLKIGLLEVELHLEACDSLKEKRQRISGLRDKFGKQTAIAVCESDYQDNWQKSQWSFLVAASDKATVDRILSNIETYLSNGSVDAVITNISKQYW